MRGASSWTLQQTLTAPSGTSNDFGSACALDGSTAAVGASGVDVGGATQVGAIYVFTRAGVSWTLQQQLGGTDQSSRRFFGGALALLADELVVGASGSPGAAYVFQRSGATWTQQQRIVDTTPNRGFGQAVGLTASTLFVGIYSSSARGAVAFSRTGTPPAPTPGAPTNFQAGVSGNTVTMTWGAPGSGSAPTGYTVVARTTSGQLLTTLPVGNTLGLTVAAPNGVSQVSVVASNAQGIGPESASRTVTVPATAPVPGAPSALAATVAGTSATLTWNPPAAGGAPAGYLLLAGTAPSFTAPIATLPLPASPARATVGGVPPGSYWVRLVAGNATGTGAASNEINVVVAGPTLPGAPSLNAATRTGRTVHLSWTPGAGGTPTSFVVTASVTPGGTIIASLAVGATGVSVADVPPGTYYVQVRAVNSVGASSTSNTITVVVP